MIYKIKRFYLEMVEVLVPWVLLVIFGFVVLIVGVMLANYLENSQQGNDSLVKEFESFKNKKEIDEYLKTVKVIESTTTEYGILKNN